MPEESLVWLGTSPGYAPVMYDPVLDRGGELVRLWCAAEHKLKSVNRAWARSAFTWSREAFSDHEAAVRYYRLLSPTPLNHDEAAPQTQRRQEEIKWQVATRGITRLVHYTRQENLPGIFTYGLVGRWAVEKLREEHDSLACYTNDPVRADERRDAVCVSITMTNRRQFASHARLNTRSARWAVLFINPRILWRLPCLFCHTNAASQGDWDFDRSGVEAFRRMFADPHVASDTPQRRPRDRDLNLPLDEQAEVLVLKQISAEDLLAVAVKSRSDANRVHSMSLPVPIKIESRLFPRMRW